MSTATWKAIADIAALVIIFGGTVAITLGGVPALIPNLLTIGGRQITIGGRPLGVGTDPASAAAYRHYMAWAIPGIVAIGIGMLWQAVAPATVLWSGFWHWVQSHGGSVR